MKTRRLAITAPWYFLHAGFLAYWLTWLLLAHNNILLFVALQKIFKSSTLLPKAALCTADGSNYMITLPKSHYDSYIIFHYIYQTLWKLGKSLTYENNFLPGHRILLTILLIWNRRERYYASTGVHLSISVTWWFLSKELDRFFLLVNYPGNTWVCWGTALQAITVVQGIESICPQLYSFATNIHISCQNQSGDKYNFDFL